MANIETLMFGKPDGYVIIDHKSYPGNDAAEHAKQYAPQLAAYKQAVEKATGKPVLAQLIHMQNYGVRLDKGAECLVKRA